jgi:glycosyltransferase involved in cell wall biosynthesis
VSIVTPVYNTEKYLKECMESILNQTYENWEYVIVNNCSTDRSLKIAQEYAKKDNRIRIHNNEKFLDLIDNWNNSLKLVSPKCKYVKVVHADDFIFPECIEKMVEVGEKNKTAAIVGAYRLEEEKVTLDVLSYPSVLTSGRKICRLYLLQHRAVFGSPTSLLIRYDEIIKRNPFYNSSNLHADVEVCFDILKDRDFGFVHQVLTFTRRHNESITSSSKFYGTNFLGNLLILKNYGAIFLNKKELRQVKKRFLNRYYFFLARRIFWLRKKEFWKRKAKFFEFQKKMNAKVGEALRWDQIIKFAIILACINILEKVKSSFEVNNY